jgi:hypothetical protein
MRPITFPFGGPVVQHDRSRISYKIAAGCFSRVSIGFRGPVLQRYSTNDANLIPVTLCVRRILARPALLALRRAFIHAMRLLLTSVGYKSNRHGCPIGYRPLPTGPPRGPIFSAFFPGIWREKKPRSANRAPIQWTQCLTATNRRPNSHSACQSQSALEFSIDRATAF